MYYRYLATDKKNGMNRLTTMITKKLGILGKDEEFNSETLKCKLIFLTVQAVYTIVASLPTLFLYSSYTLSVIYICVIYSWCIWRGGTYYIEVFSERYKMKFVKIEKEEDCFFSRENSLSPEPVADSDMFDDVAQASNAVDNK